MAMTDREREALRTAKRKSDPEYNARYLARKRAQWRMKRPPSDAPGNGRKKAWRAKNPEKDKLLRDANHAVEYAVRTGKMKRPSNCSKCGAGGRIEAHHHRGYAKEFRLDVVWLCTVCHGAAEVQARREQPYEKDVQQMSSPKQQMCKK